MRKTFNFICIIAILFITTSCGAIEKLPIKYNSFVTTKINEAEDAFDETIDANSTYTGYTLLLKDFNSFNANGIILVGDISIDSNDSYNNIENIEVNSEDIEIITDDENKLVTIQGNSFFKKDEVQISVKGNISKIRFINAMLDADIKIDTVADVNIRAMPKLNGDINVNAKQLFLHLQGMGSINISGTVEETRLEQLGAGNIKALDLVSENTEIRLDGVGHCEVYTTNNLNVFLSGFGEVKYSGNPVNVNKGGSDQDKIREIKQK